MLKKYSIGVLGLIFLSAIFYLVLSSFPRDVKISDLNNGEIGLTEKNWEWVKLVRGDEEVLAKSDLFVLTFNEDGSLGSMTDCNSVGGNYEIMDSALEIRELFSTLMYCEGSQEQIYVNSLQEAESYLINNGELIITNKFGDEMYFVVN